MVAKLISTVSLCIFVFLLQGPAPRPPENAQGDKQHSTTEKDNSAPRNTTSFSAQLPNAETAVKQGEAEHNHGNSSADWWAMFAAGATIIIAGATVAQALIYKRQAALMERSLAETKRAADAATSSAQTAREALELIERADVVVEGAETKPGNPIRPESQIWITLRNFGQTRAIDVSVNGYFGALDPLVHSPLKETSLVLPPQSTHRFGSPALKDWIPLNPFLGPAVDRLNLHAFIEVSYKDVFGGAQTATATLVFDGSSWSSANFPGL